MQRIRHMVQLNKRVRTRWMLITQTGIRYYDAGDYLKSRSNHTSGTMTEVFRQIRERIGIDQIYKVVPKSREHLLQYTPKPEQLPARSMQDTYTSAILPLEKEELSRERYINHNGTMRMGRLLEELDMFAVWICHRHVKTPELPKDVALPYTFVTLLVDRVEFSNIDTLEIDKDVELSGFVSWTGTTSLEATLYVRQIRGDTYLKVTKAFFLMVARNATNTGPAPINKLEPANEMESRFWNEAVQRREKRRLLKSTDITSMPPKEHEQAMMFRLLKRTSPSNNFVLNQRVLPPNCHWMVDSKRSSIVHPFPENRNAANTIFGGYLMRQAVEISFIMASIYISGRPKLRCISDITFLKPVSVQAFVEMTAQIVFTAHNYVQLMTVARTWDVNTNQQHITNVFNLTYEAEADVNEVMPGSYEEMLWYIHGRRKLLDGLHLQPDYDGDLNKENNNKEPK